MQMVLLIRTHFLADLIAAGWEIYSGLQDVKFHI